MKSYLQGTWVGIDTATKDTVERPFNFTYQKKSDSAGYLDPQEWKEMHVTFFDIGKTKKGYNITFISLYGNSKPVWNIKKVTNLELIFERENEVMIYRKISFKKRRTLMVYR
ncbi:hypothetical protein EWM62_05950 [Mucilaginibacter terrigena]|uniref:Uncharacterized protein n=1 Tax=Mucilaginibacter terrigena TaxID=2492395 RepID=A0A4V1ZC55_9SPHI|nr:hypothetical protein [Mucilaginibacter terrigena]RYU91480.1 hypothetical protein EWM62_05950 [Mucilaginibacter terrigena]